MRPTKLAIADALRTDPAVGELVPAAQVFSVERATVPTLPAVEIIAISSERVDTGPLVKHELSIEYTVSDPTEVGADALLDSIVRAVRLRLADAEHSERPIQPSGRWKRPGRTGSDTVVYLSVGCVERDQGGERARQCRGRRIGDPQARRDGAGPEG